MDKNTLTWKLHRKYAEQLVDAGVITEPVEKDGTFNPYALEYSSFSRLTAPVSWVSRIAYVYQDRLHQLWEERGKPDWELDSPSIGEWSDVDENGWVRFNINDFLHEWVEEEFLQADLLAELINEILQERKGEVKNG